MIVGMNDLLRSIRLPKINRIRNVRILEIMKIISTILDDILPPHSKKRKEKQLLIRYEHLKIKIAQN